MDVELDDGTIIEGVPDGTTQAQLMARLNKRTTAQEQPKRGFLESAGRYAAGAGEAVAQFGTGAIGSVAGGLAGVGTGVNRALGLTQQEPADAVRGVSQALTYQPRTEEGVQLSNIVNYPFEKIAEGADYVGGAATDKTGSPTLGMQAATTLQAIPMLFGGVRGQVKGALRKSEQAAEGRKSAMSERDATLEAARQEGYVVPPSASGASGFMSNRAESVAGKAATKQEASARNQSVSDNIARREAGLAENEPMSRRTLEAARERLAEPYREVAAVSRDAAQALEILKETKFEMNLERGHYFRTGDPATYKKWKALEKDVDGWERFIDEQAVSAGKPDLLPRLIQARQKLAKNYDVEAALNVGSGSVDAAVFGRMMDKKRPLSGGLETIGRFAEAFGEYAQHGNKGPGISKVEAGLGAVLGIGGTAALGPAGAVAGLLPLLSHPTRSMLLSEMGQVRPKYQSNAALRLVDRLADAPAEIAPAESSRMRLRDMRLQEQ